MSRSAIVYTCSNCDAQYPKWVGRCQQCGKFGTVSTTGTVIQKRDKTPPVNPLSVSTVNLAAFKDTNISRFSSGYSEVDRVLGGGIVPGSVVFLSGEPGAGKSTLLLALAGRVGKKVLYASGEESAEQVAARLARLSIKGDQIIFAATSELDGLVAAIGQQKPPVVMVDSLQTMVGGLTESLSSSTTRIRTVITKLIESAKINQTAIFIIGHVTKEGVAAGPKFIEHLVDVVLQLEGGPNQELRFLRASKNRFGTTEEVGVFQMTAEGMKELVNPSELFLAERHQGAGSCITAVLEGSRSLLIEVQALVTHSRLAYPKRATSGFDTNRLSVLLAVLAERGGIKLTYSDVYVNLAGGFRSREPALDLAVVAAVASAALKKPLPSDLVIFGEVGLGGEVRPVVGVEKRLVEAQRLGFGQVLVPLVPPSTKIPSGLAIIPVRTVAEAVDWLRH